MSTFPFQEQDPDFDQDDAQAAEPDGQPTPETSQEAESPGLKAPEEGREAPSDQPQDESEAPRRGQIRVEEPVKLSLEEGLSGGARIKVVGIGGGGCNAVNRMIESGIEGVEFIAANTDVQALRQTLAPIKIQLGEKLTKGLGAGSNPEIGRQAALEDTDKLIELLDDADMVFVTVGLGGGTGTGGAPIVASLATELSALTVAVVTKPFNFEGRKRAQQCEQGLRDLQECADTVITIPNERLLTTVPAGTTLADSFKFADDVLRQAVQGISDLITVPGVINLDFADVKTIMTGMGMALMGTGIASGEDRALEAARKAINSPLLEDTSIEGARGVLINITGSSNLTLHEVSEASRLIQESAHPDAHIIFGSVFNDRMGDDLKITVIATGYEDSEEDSPRADGEVVERRLGPPQRSDSEKQAKAEALRKHFDRPLEEDSDLDVPTYFRQRQE
ncbi:MAG TPA: cell division protein FtsZ [Acidobacteriota bacterium]|nr:cell division protein FtsZ [Acidobacteriota bacterium]